MSEPKLTIAELFFLTEIRTCNRCNLQHARIRTCDEAKLEHMHSQKK